MDCSPPGSSVHGFPRQEYWRGLPFPSPRVFPTQGSNLHLLHPLHWRAGSAPLSHWEAHVDCTLQILLWRQHRGRSQALGFPGGSADKESTRNAGDLIPGLGRFAGGENGYPLQYSGLENSMGCVVSGSQRVGWDFHFLSWMTPSLKTNASSQGHLCTQVTKLGNKRERRNHGAFLRKLYGERLTFQRHYFGNSSLIQIN